MDQEKRVRHVLLWVGGILMVWLVVLVLIRIGYAYQWTGFAERTIWNWLQLLLGVTVTALIAYFGQRISRLQYLGQQEVEKNRAQDEALQAYLAQIGNLLLDKATLLRQSEEGAEDRPSSARQSEDGGDGGDGGLRDSSERPPSMADMADFEFTTTTTDNRAYVREDRQDRQGGNDDRRGDENSTPPSDSANVGGHAFHRDPTAYEETF